jgi:hypothetical protein
MVIFTAVYLRIPAFPLLDIFSMPCLLKSMNFAFCVPQCRNSQFPDKVMLFYLFELYIRITTVSFNNNYGCTNATTKGKRLSYMRFFLSTRPLQLWSIGTIGARTSRGNSPYLNRNITSLEL